MQASGKRKIFVLLSFFLLGHIIPSISSVWRSESVPESFNPLEQHPIRSPETGGFWSTNHIHILNDNWSATTVDWIQVRSGTLNDPHIIENVSVNGENVNGRSCILIENSQQHFIVHNCTCFNSGYSDDAGIKLLYSNNGQLIGNNVSLNVYGIYLRYSNDTKIVNNNASNNWNYGIHAYGGHNILIQENIASGQLTYNGIELERCVDSSVLVNVAQKNKVHGIFVRYSQDVRVSDNFAINNTNDGIQFYRSYENQALGNNCSWNGLMGLRIYRSNYTDVEKNVLMNNSANGIYINEGYNNTIQHNNLTGNGWHGLESYDSESSKIQGNVVDWNQIGISLNATTPSASAFHTVLKNAFIGNELHAHDNGTKSAWNNSYGGNYWDNVTAPDSDWDGVCDGTIYDISGPAVAKDYLPIAGSPFQNGSSVYIDGRTENGKESWQWVATRAWCLGIGTESEPFIIQDLTIDAEASGSCIFVEHSRVEFSITHCNLTNSGATIYDAAIRMNNVTNGNLESNICKYNNQWALYLNEFNHSAIVGNVATNNTRSVRIYDSEDVNVLNNNLNSSEDVALSLLYVDNSTIKGNTIFNHSAEGIQVQWGDRCFVHNNKITNASQNGILFREISNACASDNTIQFTEIGIEVRGAHDINFTRNIVFNASVKAVYVHIASKNVTFAENTFRYGDDVGIAISVDSDHNNFTGNIIRDFKNYGAKIDYLAMAECNFSLFFNNTFSNPGAINAWDGGNDTAWDNGSLGNFWHDYGGVDADDDGMGDSNYFVPGTSEGVDRFPIWTDADDAPLISIQLPKANVLHDRTNPPMYSVTKISADIVTMWYTLGNNETQYPFSGTSGTINEIGWGCLPNGSIKITFSAQDLGNHIGSSQVEVHLDNLGPQITIAEPLTLAHIGVNAPNFTLSIAEANGVSTIWYTIDGGIAYTCQETGRLNQLAWDELPERNITLRFYANDSLGNVGWTEVVITKDLSVGGTSGDDDSLPWWLQAALAGAISATAGIIIKASYNAKKKQKELFGQIVGKLKNVEDIGAFLQSNLDPEDWKRLQTAWKKYESNEITPKELIKEGKKTAGSRFLEIFATTPRKSKTTHRKIEIPSPSVVSESHSPTSQMAPSDPTATALEPSEQSVKNEIEIARLEIVRLSAEVHQLDRQFQAGTVPLEEYLNRKNEIGQKIGELTGKLNQLSDE